jgi:hypothetical protein
MIPPDDPVQDTLDIREDYYEDYPYYKNIVTEERSIG